MVANDVSQPGVGFDADSNAVKILDPQGNIEDVPILPKRQVADRILDRVATLLKK
jgi:phosphopantothenoylcysteine decarboxylase/phosphopantothenate--cysteine ligase